MYRCMRTNIVLNDDLVREAMRYSRSKSKSALVEEALRTYVEVRSAEERRRSYKERLVAVQQVLGGKRFRESAADILAHDRRR
jgi:Arc/MetJ family transcription regulator